MNNIIQGQLDRVETALTALIESIASYNPSVPTTNNLLAADDQLRKGLKQLTQHQQNHVRILDLHDKITRQNTQITTTLKSLADARSDLLSIPVSLPTKESRSVPYAELLDYAKRISRNTIPPTFRPPPPAPLEAQPASTPQVANGSADTLAKPGENGTGKGTEALEDVERIWLEPLKQIPFVPWVTDDIIKMGALNQIQAMVERGEDPAKVGTEEIKEADQMGESVEGVQNEGAAQEINRRRERQPKKQQEEQVFGGLDLFDPDELG